MPPTNPRTSAFSVVETHGRVLRRGNRLVAHSQDVGWRSIYAAVFEEAPFDATEPAIGSPSLIYHLSRPTEVVRRIEDAPRERALIQPRRLCVTPGTARAQWQHAGHPEILQVYLRQSLYEAAVSELYGCDGSSAELVPRFAIVDPLLEQLAIALSTALRDRTIEDGLYVDTIAQMLAVHLAREHSSRSKRVRVPAAPTVSGRRMHRLLEFIEENLECSLSLAALAAVVDLRPLYFVRAFKTALGRPPHQYVLERRIERAQELLRTTEMTGADIAAAVGFSSQSHLSYWMRRAVGISPEAYRRQIDA
jgi:AraC family transcriptional regulator